MLRAPAQKRAAERPSLAAQREPQSSLQQADSHRSIQLMSALRSQQLKVQIRQGCPTNGDASSRGRPPSQELVPNQPPFLHAKHEASGSVHDGRGQEVAHTIIRPHLEHRTISRSPPYSPSSLLDQARNSEQKQYALRRLNPVLPSPSAYYAQAQDDPELEDRLATLGAVAHTEPIQRLPFQTYSNGFIMPPRYRDKEARGCRKVNSKLSKVAELYKTILSH